jgi:hypothetical protein
LNQTQILYPNPYYLAIIFAAPEEASIVIPEIRLAEPLLMVILCPSDNVIGVDASPFAAVPPKTVVVPDVQRIDMIVNPKSESIRMLSDTNV